VRVSGSFFALHRAKKRGLGLLDPHGVNLLREFLYTVLFMYTVIRFVSMSAKFGICTVVGLKKTLQVRILASTSVPFRPTTVQMPNLALIETKRSTVFLTT
jgi:hypothetical protein